MNWYFDIESEGLNPEKDKIITIQYQKIDNCGKPIGDLIILKEWQEGEEQIVKKFHKLITTYDPFFFIPIMQNHLFDFRFIFSKFRKYGLKLNKSEIDFLYSIPLIDIHSLLVIMNNMNFKGSGLSDMTEKKERGDYIVKLYKRKEYHKIEEYIIQETNSFLKAFQVFCRELPKLKNLIRKNE